MPHVNQLRMVAEIVLLVVLHHEKAVGEQHIFFKNQVGNNVDGGQGIWRPGKDVVVLRGGISDKPENIHLKNMQAGFDIQLLGDFSDKLNAGGKLIYVGGIRAATGDKLIAMTPRATEQIQHFYGFKIKAVIQDIEQRLLGNIRSRPRWPIVGGRIEPPALKFSSNNAHNDSG